MFETTFYEKANYMCILYKNDQNRSFKIRKKLKLIPKLLLKVLLPLLLKLLLNYAITDELI